MKEFPENISLKEIKMVDTVPGAFGVANFNFKEIESLLNIIGSNLKDLGKTQDIGELFSQFKGYIEKEKISFVLRRSLQTGINETVVIGSWEYTISRIDPVTFIITRNFSSTNPEDWNTLPLIIQVKNSDGIVVECQMSTRENAISVQFNDPPEENLLLLAL